MRVLSLFDGMACGHIAFDNLNIQVNNYDAYEIDSYAIKVATHNFPDITERGDVFEADFTRYRGYDWLIGGSPCTYWSIAKTKNRETIASGMGWELFSQYLRALQDVEPKYFLYENNKSMSKEIRASIDNAFGFEAICINSALVSAQNRQRLYWVGVRQSDGTYRKAEINQPEDRGVLLRDILETTTGEKRYCMAEPVNVTTDGKSQTLKAQYIKNNIANFCKYTSTYGASGVAEPVCVAERGRVKNGEYVQHYEARDDGKTNAITTVQKDNSVAESVRIGTIENNLKNKNHDSKQYRVYSPDAKATTLCGQGGGVGAKTGLYACPTLNKAQNVYEVKNGYITVKGEKYPIKLADGFYIIRKLTVTECKRLQTVPDWYDMGVISNSQCYKCLGNGWTIDVISHLISQTMQNDS